MLYGLAHALRGFKVAALLDAVQTANKLCGLDGFHRQVAYPRENVQFQMPDHLSGITGRPLPVFFRLAVPSTRQEFKGVEPSDTITLVIRATRFPGIYAAGPLLSLRTGLLARCHQRYDGIVPKAQFGFLAHLLVTINPYLGGRSHAKVQTLAVRKQIFFFERLCRLDLEVVELSHGVPKID
ncbi:MAG: hypothetical protein Q7J84_16005 [Sulfuricaulis sp.]|nr:hypothetical protein [Sulfuricaulis sp.]